MFQNSIKEIIRSYQTQYFNPRILSQLAVHVLNLSATPSLVTFCSTMKLYDMAAITK